MKRKVRKIALHRETLRRLDLGQVGRRAAGGTGTYDITCTRPETEQHTFCLTDCPWCPTDTATSQGGVCTATCTLAMTGC